MLYLSIFILNFCLSIQAFSISSHRKTSLSQSLDATKESISTSTGQLEKTKDGVYICKQMPPPLPNELKNTYYLLRHGQSWGNVEGVISSARSLATSEKHGLTQLGYEQGRGASDDLLKLIERNKKESDGDRKKKLFFISSPFSRARQTAMACLEGLQTENNQNIVKDLNLDIQEGLTIEHGLMERYFGRLDDAAIHTYVSSGFNFQPTNLFKLVLDKDYFSNRTVTLRLTFGPLICLTQLM